MKCEMPDKWKIRLGKHESSRRLLRVRMAAGTFSVNIAIVPLLQAAPADASPTFTKTNLVSDVDGMAKFTDPNLVNPWGMTLGTNSGLWVSNNGSGMATTYDGTGKAIPAGTPLVVKIPAPGNNGGNS